MTRTACQLTKIGKMQPTVCRLCSRAREARSESLHDLTVKKYGHINGVPKVISTDGNEHHKSIVGTLRAAAPLWVFESINFVVCNRRSVVEQKLVNEAQ